MEYETGKKFTREKLAIEMFYLIRNLLTCSLHNSSVGNACYSHR
uniref:Uncharacterized protein n=1 Tax=Lepeophtheirus salmonis TaxID=72036 RepID=A0A0K2VIX9_LEPSM